MPSKTSSFSIGSLPLLGSYRIQSFDARSKLNEDVRFSPLKPGDLGAAPTVEKLDEILILTLGRSLDYHCEQLSLFSKRFMEEMSILRGIWRGATNFSNTTSSRLSRSFWAREQWRLLRIGLWIFLLKWRWRLVSVVGWNVSSFRLQRVAQIQRTSSAFDSTTVLIAKFYSNAIRICCCAKRPRPKILAWTFGLLETADWEVCWPVPYGTRAPTTLRTNPKHQKLSPISYSYKVCLDDQIPPQNIPQN